MSSSSAPIIRHVSRQELAQNRIVWLATGGMYALFAIGTGAIIMFVGGMSPLRMQVMAVLLVIIAAVHLLSEPPAIGTLANHLVIACVWASTGVAFWAFQPGGGIALGAVIFIGPLTAVRLQDGRQIAAHLVCANAFAIAIAIGTGVNQATLFAITLMVPATCTLAFSCAVVLAAAEDQGDELERLVRRDPLTGAGNRRLLDERLADEIRRHERTGRPLSIVTLDLNGFKAINEAFGHSAGDELLRDVATTLRGIATDRDTLVRQGVDEFCLILPETSAAQSARTVHAIRAAFTQAQNVGRPITTGIGVASFPDDAIEPHVLLHVADERLRANKLQAAGSTPNPQPSSPPKPRRLTT